MKGVSSLGRLLNVFRKAEASSKSNSSGRKGEDFGSKSFRVKKSRSSKLLRLQGGREEEYEVFLSFHHEEGLKDVKAIQEGEPSVV